MITMFGGLNAGGIRSLYYLQLLVICGEFALLATKFHNPKSRSTQRINSGILKGVQEVMQKGVAVKRFLLYQSILMVPFFLNAIYIPLYAANVKKADAFTLGGMLTASLLVPLLLSIPSGRLADRIGRKKVIYGCLPLFSLSLILLAFAPESSPVMLIAAGVFQGFYVLAIVTGNAMRAELVPIHLLGSWSGLLGLFGGIVGIIIPVSAGLLWNAVNPASVLILLILSQAIAACVLFTIPETLKLKTNV